MMTNSKEEKTHIHGKSGGLHRWFQEKWVDVCRTDARGHHPPCGRSHASATHEKHATSSAYPYCRPSRRVSGASPRSKTAGEMSDAEKKAACAKKQRDPSKRMPAAIQLKK